MLTSQVWPKVDTMLPDRDEMARLIGEILFYQVHIVNRMSQTELAKRLGVSDVTVSRWMHGKMVPPPGRRRKIEKELGLKQRTLDYPQETLDALKETGNRMWVLGLEERERALAAGEEPDYNRQFRKDAGPPEADPSEVEGDETGSFLDYTLRTLRHLDAAQREEATKGVQLLILQQAEEIGVERFGVRAKAFIERLRQRIQRGEPLGPDGAP